MKKTTLFSEIILLLLLSYINPLTAQVIPDFPVNEYVSINGSEQSDPCIDGDGNGNFVVTWMDDRNGSNFDIFVQIYLNDSTTSGNNFKVNDDEGTAAQYNPAIAVDPNFNFVVTWIDMRNGNPWDIYAQRFSNDGTALGSNFKVNEEPGNEEQEHPSVSIDSSGNFVIVWADEKSGDWDIYGQRYSAGGTALDSNFKISDDTGNSIQYWPTSSGDKNGNFIVSWGDERNGDFDIYYQYFLEDGTALGNNVKVNTDVGNSMQLRTDITVDEAGNYSIVWEDKRYGNWDIYAQRYTSDANPLGDNFILNEDTLVSDQRNASISCDLYGNFVVSWEDDRDEYTDIYARQFSYVGTPLGDDFKVNDNLSDVYQYYSGISSDNEGNFIIVWEDHRFGYNSDVFAQPYLNDGTAIGVNYKVNDDIGSANQIAPSIAKDNSDNFIIAWIDNRNYFTDIYAQRFSSDGTALGSNFKVNDDTAGYAMYQGPSVSADAAGNFVVAWKDYRYEYWGEIYAQRFSSDGIALGPNFKVNNMGYCMVYGATVACKKNGDFIIVWGDDEDGGKYPSHSRDLNERKGLKQDFLTENKNSQPDIWAQQYLSDGTPLGGNFKVNDDEGNTRQVAPAIAIDSSGNFIIVWEDDRDGEWDIYAQRYLSDGTPLDSNIKVVDSLILFYSGWPSISSDDAGNFIIAWKDNRNGNYDIWGQRYLNDGSPLGYNFLVNDDNGTTTQSSPCISADGNGKFIITWTDWRNGNNDVYAQRYLSNGDPFGSNYRVSNTGELSQSLPAVVLGNDRIFTTWQDNRDGQTGFDVYANVFDWDYWVGIEYNIPNEIPLQPCLNQNYPNPFYEYTEISYTLYEPGFVTLNIYDQKGRKIKSLVNEYQNANNYSIQMDDSKLDSGVYYYCLEVDKKFMETKKMIIIR